MNKPSYYKWSLSRDHFSLGSRKEFAAHFAKANSNAIFFGVAPHDHSIVVLNKSAGFTCG
jgi:hypothetical protein